MSTNSLHFPFSERFSTGAAAVRVIAQPRMTSIRRVEHGAIQLFVFLQVLDVLTTLVGFKLGAAEASPMVRLLLQAGPITGLILSKVIGLTLCGICVFFDRLRLIHWANYWYSALAVWNLFIILSALGPR